MIALKSGTEMYFSIDRFKNEKGNRHCQVIDTKLMIDNPACKAQAIIQTVNPVLKKLIYAPPPPHPETLLASQ